MALAEIGWHVDGAGAVHHDHYGFTQRDAKSERTGDTEESHHVQRQSAVRNAELTNGLVLRRRRTVTAWNGGR